MKLVFPNGEHDPAPLTAGVNTIGTSPGSGVVLPVTGVGAQHCEIHVTGSRANVQVPPGGGPVLVNGQPVHTLMALRGGDRIDIGDVLAEFVVDAARGLPAPATAPLADDDTGATRVRMALPKFVLRGVSGAVAGKVFPLAGPAIVGRAPECDITVHVEEISRRHVMLRPVGDGLSVEDLGSSNGTYINGARVQHGFLNPGDELRLDTVCFALVAPGMDVSPRVSGSRQTQPVMQTASVARRQWMPVMLTVAALLTILGLVLGFA